MRTPIAAAAAVAMLLSSAALAANDGELWEVTSQMNIPGMPAGMGGSTSQICRGGDPKEEVTKRRDMSDCKITDVKQSGTRFTLTASCPRGPVTIDQTYNAARTEYKGTITMSDRGQQMVMNTSGRKVGTCDVAQFKSEREDKAAKAKAQSEAQVAAMNKNMAETKAKSAQQSITACNAAVTAMDASKFPPCLQPGSAYAKSASCTDPRMAEYNFPADARAACDPKKAEYCRNIQTESGFARAVAADRRSSVDGAEVCGLQKVSLQQKLCQGAVQRESLDFLADQCPGEAKQAGARLCPSALKKEAYGYVARYCKSDAQALFQKNCAGRAYTALPDKKMVSMCTRLASVEEDEGASDGNRSASAAPAPKPEEAKKQSTGRQVEQSFGKGLDKIKGLFGR